MPAGAPLFSVVAGQPEPHELAALIAVLASRSTQGTAELPATKRSLWAAHTGQVRPALGAGPGAWRASSLPR